MSRLRKVRVLAQVRIARASYGFPAVRQASVSISGSLERSNSSLYQSPRNPGAMAEHDRPRCDCYRATSQIPANSRAPAVRTNFLLEGLRLSIIVASSGPRNSLDSTSSWRQTISQAGMRLLHNGRASLRNVTTHGDSSAAFETKIRVMAQGLLSHCASGANHDGVTPSSGGQSAAATAAALTSGSQFLR